MKSIFALLLINIVTVLIVFVEISKANSSEQNPEVCPEIVMRKKWGAKTAKAVSYLTVPLEYVIIHHTVGQLCSNEKTCSRYVRNIQALHQNDNNYWDIGYK